MNKPFYELAAELARPLGVKKPDPDLRWHEIDDLGVPGWGMNIGYGLEWDDGRASIWIHRAELNTGQRVIELQLNEIDQPSLEAEIAEMEEAAAHEAARHLYETRNDDGDYSLDARRDKLAALEPDQPLETGEDSL